MSDKFRFDPVRSSEEIILQLPYSNGSIYFATDTGRVYLDCVYDGEQKNKLPVGGGGVSLIYGNDAEPVAASEEEDNVLFSLLLSTLESKARENDLILNSDGCFYKVLSVTDTIANCIRLAVSGSGGGGGGVSIIDLFLDVDYTTIDQNFTYIYGAKSSAIFIPRTETDDNTVTLTFSILNNENQLEEKYTYSSIRKGSRFSFDTSLFPLSNDITLTVTETAMNSFMPQQSRAWTFNGISTVAVGIKKANNNFITAVIGNNNGGEKILEFIPVGPTDEKNKNLVETLHVFIDGEEDVSYKKELRRGNFNTTNTINISKQPHGSHTIELAVSATVNNVSITSDKISFDVAWADVDNNDSPIVWIGNYDETVIQYENSYVQYMVLDPEAYKAGLPATIQLYKDGVMLNEFNLSYSTDGWAEWDISAIYEVGANQFSIACRGVKKDFTVNVTTEGSRELGLVKESSLIMNYTSSGRSNLELKANRSIWRDSKGNEATLSGFNWQNNGWMKDATIAGQVDNGTYLGLTNGAAVSIPCRSITMNDSDDYSIEIRFRVKNVQEYSTLVQTFPTYFYKDSDGVDHTTGGDGQLLSVIEANNWTVLRDEWGNMRMDEDNTIKNVETTKGVICKWMDQDNRSGFCIGSQEAFFKTDRGVISVRYKEDEVINITFVVSKTEGLVYIYLNGILSGANSLPVGASAAFTVDSSFNFNSDYCDIDLYRIRVFQAGLAMPDVIHNYLSDLHSIALYDQNQLTDAQRPTQLSYELLTQYNKNNKDNPTMPYTVWKVTSVADEKLPYKKGNSKKVDIIFVNPPLDRALETGVVDEWYYYTHSPSFQATGVDIDVQGTSSQGYPRRNFKTKYKKAKTWVFTKGSLAGQSVFDKHTVTDGNGVEHSLSKNFHMDNEQVGTNKFTWKIDYMESSGSYNTGFANLMGNPVHPLYSKHPLDDLGLNGEGLRTSVYGFPVLTFHEYTTYSNNPGSDGNNNEVYRYEYIGRYNMNLDKSSNEYYGFESKDPHPYVEGNPAVANIAECWELSDNQGTWCSWKYPNAAARSAGFGTTQDGYNDRLEVMRHFEYRYSPYGDQLDAIGADGKYDGVVDDSTEEGQAMLDVIGRTNSEKSAYVRNVYSNLERLFNWLDSTDTGSATGASVASVTWRTSKAYSGTGETSEPVYGYVSVSPTATYDEETTYYISAGNNIYTEAEIDPDVGFIDGVTYYTNTIIYYNTTFTNDTIGYRTEKFRNEFTKHLDKEYCLVYFIMTELLLCYDSRGKNMMMASFGPHELGGEYIWYPIFYDIDTQLGLNNSGAYLWDYDADVTADGLFSTPTSVLWTNFYAVFEDDIKNKYRELRGANNTKVSDNLNYENITGAYECNGDVFNSYAMKGVRPVIAIGLDEYYKYFATTTNVGYFDTNGTKIIESSPQYAYCCQGDKKLTTELLLRNRLNYIDSWWLGGNYEINTVKQGQFWGRVNGNRLDKTSDTYIDLTQEEIDSRIAMANDPNSPLTDAQRANYQKYIYASAATYPKPYYDSVPGFTITPFLKEYVSYYTDEVPGVPIKYTGGDGQENGVKTNVPEGTVATYKTEAESPNEQLVYIPGLDYISSLGDLSTSYFSEFSLETGKRLLDLKLGSDVPNYKNNLIDANKKFELHNGANDTGKKSLLQKMVMTGMTTFDKTLDMRGSGKLKEFRALRTKLPNVYFAKGAPLHTVHLPSTITTLELIENTELTNIITDKNVVNNICYLDSNGVAQYANPSTYRGLYIEGVTDYTSSNANAGHALSSLVIEGGGLKYGSYALLSNLVSLKKSATENKSLRISLKDVVWTPYTQIEQGTPYTEPITGHSYWKLNDHSMYDAYTYDANTWDSDVLNGLIYDYDSYLGNDRLANIANLTVLNSIIELFERQNGQFSGIIAGTMPTITGEIYLKNNQYNKIYEDGATNSLNYYKSKFPNLTIRAAYVEQSNITKYVQILESGKTEVIDLLRSTSTNPVLTSIIPAKANYDFKGWATDPAGENILLEYDFGNKEYGDMTAFNAYTISSDTKILTLYAIFEYHKHRVDFVYPDNTVITKYVTWNTTVETPTEIPFKDDVDSSGNPLPTEQTWQFLGWSTNKNAYEADERFTNGTFVVTKDYLAANNSGIYTIWSEEPISVFDNVHPEFFEIIGNTSFTDTYGDGQKQDGVLIRLAKTVKGKLTIPNTINGQRVVSIRSSASGNTSPVDPCLLGVTHIFFEKDVNGVTTIPYIYEYAFFKCINLKYFEFANGLKAIGQRAFQNIENLAESTVISGTVNNIGERVFSTAYVFSASDNRDLIIDGNVKNLFSNAFANMNNAYFNTLQIGTQNNKSSLTEFNQAFSGGSADKFNQVIIYTTDPNNTIFAEANRDQLLYSLFGNGYDPTLPVTILS